MNSFDFTTEELNRLRALRLWHLKQLMVWCERERRVDRHPMIYLGEDIKQIKNNCSFHMQAVQTLNDFFPTDDTAEKDAAK